MKNKIYFLLFIVLLFSILFIKNNRNNQEDMSQYPDNAIQINNPDLSETVNDTFSEVDTKIPGRLASFDTFSPVDVDSDGLAEKIYYVPTAMNHGAAEIWIIKSDEIIFRSKNTADRWFESTENNNGFYLLEGLEKDGEWNAISRKTRYSFREGKFIPIWYLDEVRIKN